MKSMTGYGSASAKSEQFEVLLEITSVNRRGLEIQTSLPREWQSLETEIINTARKFASRGKINIYIQVSSSNTDSGFDWNLDSISNALQQIKIVSEQHDIPFEPSTTLIFDIAKSLDISNNIPDPSVVGDFIQSMLVQALEKFIKMREKEGSALKIDVLDRIGNLSQITTAIKQESTQSVPNQRELLFNRLKDADLDLDLNDERVLKEIALFADKSDISEEIIRLESHLEQFSATANQNDPVGRKMDFICQEINREFNTIASKSSLFNITNHVINAKNELERIREQIQNVE